MKPLMVNVRENGRINVNGNVISIFKQKVNKKNKIEDTEKFLRIQRDILNEEQLNIIANFLINEWEYNDFDELVKLVDEKIHKLETGLFIEHLKKISEFNPKNLNEEMEFILLKTENLDKNKLPIFLLLERDNSGNWPSLLALQESFNFNINVLADFTLREEEIYKNKIEDITNLNDTRNLDNLDIIIPVLLLVYPYLIKSIVYEVVKKDLWEETKISRIYHENSKLHIFHQQGDFMKPLDKINSEVKKLTSKGRKIYKNKEKISLPAPTKESKHTMEDVISFRRSIRNYDDKPIEVQTLSNILYYSYGVTGHLRDTDLKLRAVPSGGGLYPVDIYLSINNVNTLDVGIYYYDPLDHALILVNNNDLANTSKEVSGYSMMLEKAAFTIILGANFWRNQWKYHERGYRIILLDCGHVAQNLHMMATTYGLGSSCLMGFVDDELNRILELDGIVEHTMYLITVGAVKYGSNNA
ncbi:SagB/ThcOx family dehydrogenase [Lysinibacillus xylanilyticus]|uniref:SagB/ThcOx family dehydrogenase n=1 Tax=Lysinibacillus xylanilyticus TaxID=582475 RepID=UPI003819D84E